MNNQRRSILRKCIKSLKTPTTQERCEEIKSTIEDVLSEEDDARDCIPESLQDSDRYTVSEESSELMESAIDSLDEAISSFDDDDLEAARLNMNEAIESLEQIDGV